MKALTVPGTLDSLESIGKYVMLAAAEAGLDKRAAYRLRLAVDEIATNIIVHGYDEVRREGVVEVSADIDEHTLTIALEDTCMPYDPRQNARPDTFDLPLEQRPIGGLGVYLAFEGVDDLRYERVDGRNRNIFIVRRPAATPPTQG